MIKTQPGWRNLTIKGSHRAIPASSRAIARKRALPLIYCIGACHPFLISPQVLCSIDRTLHSSPLGWRSAPTLLDGLFASLHELHGVFDAIVKPPWREQQQRLMRPAIKRAAVSRLPSTATDQRLLSTLSSQRSSDQHRSTAWLKRQQQSHSTHLLTDIRADRQGTDEPSASHR
ncbi:Hypothetical protein P9303_11371 [Prochlorococcus marinus str. MIT 9303]|uniref:Uncharacterized protein n=1 Tax=Prochlorococcus marinus (strain MIT 9303) TaxID=59922 RepID=A2C8S6_PROM3|nr:Hypothetical protein P9303_11371 [Prochlorococcus marinus str. MIT 9303]